MFLTVFNTPGIAFNVLNYFFMILGNSKKLMSPSNVVQKFVALELKVCRITAFFSKELSSSFAVEISSSNISRHFSHVTKSCIFKNLNLRKKTNGNFCRIFLKNGFKHLKLYSNLPSWLARSCCHMGKF